MVGPGLSTSCVKVDSRGDCGEEFIAYFKEEVSLGLTEAEVCNSDIDK